MHGQSTTPEVADSVSSSTGRTSRLSSELRERARQSALRKRAEGVPTYSVPEAAALLSISPEHLYRLIQADRFPAVRMGLSAGQGKYIVPAQVIEQLLAEPGPIEMSERTARWNVERAGGVA